MNTFAGITLLLWVAGWTLAMVRASIRVRVAAVPVVSRGELPPASGFANR